MLPEVNLAARSGGKATGRKASSAVSSSRRRGRPTSGAVRYGRAAADAQYASARRTARRAGRSSPRCQGVVPGRRKLQKRVITDVLMAGNLPADRRRPAAGGRRRRSRCRPRPRRPAELSRQRPADHYALAQSRRALEVLLAAIRQPRSSCRRGCRDAAAGRDQCLRSGRRRPDIVAAERRFAASSRRRGGRRGAAAADTAFSAALSSVSARLRAGPTRTRRFLGGAADLLPDLRWRPARGSGRAAHRRQKQAGAAYAQTAIRAFNEVETALVANRTDGGGAKRAPGLVDSQRALSSSKSASGSARRTCAPSRNSSSPPTLSLSLIQGTDRAAGAAGAAPPLARRHLHGGGQLTRAGPPCAEQPSLVDPARPRHPRRHDLLGRGDGPGGPPGTEPGPGVCRQPVFLCPR